MLLADEPSYIFIEHIQTSHNVLPFLRTYSEHHMKVSLHLDVLGAPYSFNSLQLPPSLSLP